jgi:hypothetical protein
MKTDCRGHFSCRLTTHSGVKRRQLAVNSSKAIHKFVVLLIGGASPQPGVFFQDTAINPSLGPPLETSCFKGSWKKTPGCELASTELTRRQLPDAPTVYNSRLYNGRYVPRCRESQLARCRNVCLQAQRMNFISHQFTQGCIHHAMALQR